MKDSVMRQRSPRRAVPGAIAAGAWDLSVYFEGLANPTRLAVVEVLAGSGEVTVSELARICKVSQPRMSWHLRILRHAQVICTRREGREVLCALDREAIARHLMSFARMLDRGAPAPAAADVVSSSVEAPGAPISEGVP
jgi:DNA-binding transcriptional ArsR family regulator